MFAPRSQPCRRAENPLFLRRHHDHDLMTTTHRSPGSDMIAMPRLGPPPQSARRRIPCIAAGSSTAKKGSVVGMATHCGSVARSDPSTRLEERKAPFDTQLSLRQTIPAPMPETVPSPRTRPKPQDARSGPHCRVAAIWESGSSKRRPRPDRARECRRDGRFGTGPADDKSPELRSLGPVEMRRVSRTRHPHSQRPIRPRALHGCMQLQYAAHFTRGTHGGPPFPA